MGILILIPLALLGFSIWSFCRAYRGSKSNSTEQVGQGSTSVKTLQNRGNVPFYQVKAFIYGCALLIAAIVVFFVMKSDYRKQKAKDQQRWEKQKEREAR
jgi:hypothetical protein